MYFRQLKQKEKLAEKEKWEHYAASIAAEIRRSYVKHPTKVKAADFYHEFALRNAADAKSDVVTKEERTRRAKSFWGSLVGMDLAKEN